MEGDISGVRIVPPVLEFFDTEPNVVQQLNITVKNISKSSKTIRYYGPKTTNFQLKVKNSDKPVAPGLSVPAVVEYSTSDTKEIRDRLVVTVDGDVIEIPLIGHPSQPVLEVDEKVDFGIVVANSKTIAREISLINHGSKSGEFKIKYSGDKPIAIMPSSGTVPPKSVQMIKIEYVTKQAGKINEVAKVKLQGQESKTVKIKGTIVQRTLEVLSLETEEVVDCVKFGNTYYGSDKTECALLYNNGPETVNFVALLDEDAVGQEMGVDLTKSTMATLADNNTEDGQVQGSTNILTSLVTAIPNQGILKPYEKIPIFFRFSPRWNNAKQGWKCQVAPPPRKDFALFMKIQIIGASEGFMKKTSSEAGGSCVEIALAGTALPVLLSVYPMSKFDFGECPVGEHADVLATIKNDSDVLPATFQFRRIAHFSTHPPSGKIPAGQAQDVIFSFAPNQAGSFSPQQMLDVIGQVADNRNPTLAHLEVIHTMAVYFTGNSNPIVIKREPRFNPGITPYISNEVGMFVDTTFATLAKDKPRNALVGAPKSKLHALKSSLKQDDSYYKVAFPNDRAQSVRPSDRRDNFKTIFTRADRHTYVDPDYANTEWEEVKTHQHRDSYVTLLRNMRENRLNKFKSREFDETNNSTDIGIKSAAGIRPKQIKLDEIVPDPRTPTPPNADWKLLSTKELAKAELEATSKPVCDGLNAVPVTDKEKQDCSKWLAPQQLHQVIIGPPTLDLGQVCLRSITTENLNIVNNLDQHIHIVAQIDCRELRQSSPLSQVVPPKSKAHLPIIFESNTKGCFQRSVSYTVNGFYKQHVTVLAEVVPVALELSTEELVLNPSPGMPAEAGFRGVITLYNKLNHPAEFTWAPNLGDRGTAFSIRPATGVVDAFKDLCCEVVWHPSFLAPEDGSFSLMIHGGNTLQLKCTAQLGNNSVQFVERRIMFGQVPINLNTTRTAMLANTGQNHAYFQVMDPNPFPGLSVTPVQGIVPVGGNGELKVQFNPSGVLKFDTRVEVAIKGAKMLELRIGGTVEPPVVDIDVNSFEFGGVYCGSGATLPFKLYNRTVMKAKLEFDLTRFRDFSLNFPGYQTQDDYSYQMLNTGMFTVTMAPEEVIEGEIMFMPSEVAAYDFVLPVIINQIGAPSPAPTPFPPTPAPSMKNSLQHIINPRPQPPNVVTPRKHVVATALRQPLQLSHNRLEFCLPSAYYDASLAAGLGQTKGTILVNNSDKPIKWLFDLRSQNPALEEGIFKFVHSSGAPYLTLGGTETPGVEGTLEAGQTQKVCVMFCPKEPGKYEILVPVILQDEFDKPYQYLHVIGELKSPKMWFDPLAIVLTPVPLLTDVSTEFTILASQYKKATRISVELPEVECEDGSRISPLKVSFPDGAEIKPCCGDEGQIEPCALQCKITFYSPKPVSMCQAVKFKDQDGNSFSLMVTATADNCLLTCYPFLALHRTDHQIVCEQGATPKGRKTESKESLNVGEAVFVPCVSPQHNSRPSTSATSSNFQISSSSYESSASVTDSTDQSTPENRDGAMNKPPSGSDRQTVSRNQQDLASRSLGSAMFPDEDSEEGIFHMEVLLAIQRWLSSQGWPGGPYPITVPNSLRIGITRKPVIDDVPKAAKAGSWTTSELKKEFKTIYDMIAHLSGRPVPGIPINSPLPSDPIERVKQVFWQHSTLLTFLKCQGASVAAIKPEYLMEPRDYRLWKQLQKQVKMEEFKQGEEPSKNQEVEVDDEEELEEEVFEAVSKRSWTDTALQLLKCLVLAKVTPRSLKNTPSPDKNVCLPSINPDPLSSNIYSVGERIILAWLNHHYEHYRQQIWSKCAKGGVPPSRWIVNYDFDLLDGLVLGAVLGAHMPFVMKTHLQDMYTHPATAEQCLHNALKIVNAMRYAGIDYDIQAIDITDPNPISLLLLCVHLYQRLPQYLPKASIEFTGSLHSTVTRQVKLSNPSGKPLGYQVLIAGGDARDFHVPKGEFVSIPPKSTLPLSVEFKSRFLRPTEAILVLVGRRQGSAVGSNLTFNLWTQVDNIVPKNTIKSESPCYELQKISVPITNPFDESGEFRIVLVEASGNLLDPNRPQALLKRKEKKRRRVKARVNHGQKRPETPPSPPPKITDSSHFIKKDEELSSMSAFFSPISSIKLEAHASTSIEIHFMPFSVGERQCSAIFINEDIGEFLYSVEATATEPLPSQVPFVKTPHSVRISSAAAAGSGRGLFGGDDRVVYWRCEAGQTLYENLLVPVANAAREKALMMAAQQHMTMKELQRRQTTGTLFSSSVTAQTVTKLSTTSASAFKLAKSKKPQGNAYTVEVDSDYFTVQDKLLIEPPGGNRSQSAPIQTRSRAGLDLQDGCVDLPVKFKAKEPGHYPCQITLRGADDVRVYKIECTVNPEGSTAELDFSAPVHQSVTQEIPVVNMTNQDWPLSAAIQGVGFHGPPHLLAKAFLTTKYPLVFRPQNEVDIEGKLVLTNTEDGTEHVFHLKGKPEKPLALEHITLKCQTKKSTTYTLKVPNVTKKKLCFKAESDVPFISGNISVTVLPGKTATYTMTITPSQRGIYKGIMAFVAGRNPVVEVDSDGDEVVDEDEESHEYYGYRVWYSLDIQVKPPPPERILEVTCACQKKAVLEVVVRNPTPETITLDATITGRDLSGPSSITLGPGEKDSYALTFAPAVIGKTKGSLIFYNDSVGEFWYELHLMAESPPPTTLPHMECELGRWTKQNLVLENPTDETLELQTMISNSNNFSLERDNERPIILRPHSHIQLPLHFMPSTLGQGDHLAKIVFLSEQLGEWTFVTSGTGMLPQAQDPVSVFTAAGSNTTLIIPFRNPMDEAVSVDVLLKDTDQQLEEVVNGYTLLESPFCLLLKHKCNIHVGPKSTLDIPICFAPTEMRKYESLCTVIVRREDGSRWQFAPTDSKGYQLSRTGIDGLSEIRWLYPIHGIPESKPVKDTQGAVIDCKARDRVEERLEVTLAGVAPAASGPQKSIVTRAITPKDQKPKVPDGIVVGETLATADEFTFELSYGSSEAADDLQSSVALSLVRQQRDTNSGLVTLVYNVIYSPFKAMNHSVHLVVKATTGGIWKFPLRFSASEPPVDDVILIEATGLKRESTVGFRLYSQARHPVMYSAFFGAGSDSEFTITPQTGELLPEGSSGTMIQIGFTPDVYGKLYQAKLIVQTPDMQWSYQVKGVLPNYAPPRGRSSQPMAGPHPDPRYRGDKLNFIRQNMRLNTTAVSSPVKGAPILMKPKLPLPEYV